MKPAFLLCAAIAASAATSWIVLTSSAPRSAAPTQPSAEPSPELARVRESLATLQRDHDALRQTLDDLRAQAANRGKPQSRIPLGEIDAAVARALAARSDEIAPAPRAALGSMSAAPKAFDSRAAFDELVATGLSWEDAQAKWKEIADAGGLDAVVAMFEQIAEDRPDDPEAQVELGKAYLQKVFRAGGGPEAGVWATKADKSFDQALALDDRNWEARFSKAVSLSFWPPVFGKQTEAIKHFEVLVAQQDGQPRQAEHAQTHVLLGNMYQQLGDREKALAAWRRGLSLFPDDADLLAQIANAGGQ